MAVSTTALVIASLATSAVGAGVSYYNQKAAAETTVKIGEYNSKLRQNQALQQFEEDREQLRREKRSARRSLSALRAKMAKSGVTLEGSPMEVLGHQAGMIRLRELEVVRASESRRRFGLAEAEQIKFNAGAQSAGMKRAATGTLLSAGASMARSGVDFYNQGAI